MSPQVEPTFLQQQRDAILFNAGEIEIMFFASLLWAYLGVLLLDLIWHYTAWYILTPILAVLLPLAVYTLKKRRYKCPVTDQELLQLFKTVMTDFGIKRNIEMWHRDSDRQILTSTSNLLFSSVLVSESVEHDLKKDIEHSKVVLAKQLLRIKKHSPVRRFVISVAVFILYSLFEFISVFGNALGFGLFELLLMFGPMMILIIIIVVIVVFVGALVLGLRSDGSDEQIEDKYGVDPFTADLKVFSGLSPEPEEKDESKEGIDFRGVAKKAVPIGLVFGAVSFILLSQFVFTSSIGYIFAGAMSLLLGAFTVILIVISYPLYVMQKKMKAPRNTESDIDDTTSREVERFIQQHGEYTDVSARTVKLTETDRGVVLYRKDKFGLEDTLLGISPPIVSLLAPSNHLSPYVLAELERDRIENKWKRPTFGVVGVLILFLAISLVWNLFMNYPPRFDILIVAFVVYVVLAVTLLVPMELVKKRMKRNVDMRIAEQYPEFLDALRILVDSHFTRPYGITSFKTRLERIEQNLDESGNRDFATY